MRVKRRTHDEGGAVAVMIALALVVLLGMLALVVDLGRAVGVKRDMVNAADAAALAAAQQCALGNGPGAAQGDALASAELNGADEELLFSFEPTGACSPEVVQSAGQKFVHVRYGTLVEYFVAPVLGFDDVTVTASATAMWMVPGVVPITVNTVPLQECDTENPEGGEECPLEYPRSSLDSPRWGILNVATWGDSDAAPCPVPNSEVVDIIQSGGWPRPDDAPNYACMDNGAQFASWDELIGGTWWFPVIDVDASTGVVVPAHGQADRPCTGAQIEQLQSHGENCQIDTAWVIDFVQLKVLDVDNQGSTIILETETVPPPRSSAGIEIRLVD